MRLGTLFRKPVFSTLVHTHFQKKQIFKNYEYENKDHKPIYLAHREDYTKISYANFRVFIPLNLIKNGTICTDKNGDSLNTQSEAINIISTEYHPHFP